jgi:replicative DNA helicase
MARRIIETKQTTTDETITIPHDATNEAIVLAAAIVDEDARKKLFKRLVADHFVASEHRNAWNALGEMHRRGLVYDRATVESLAGRQVAMYLDGLRKLRPDVPENLDWHVATLLWDAARVRAAKNSVPAFLEALRDSKADPERVRSLARAVGQAFDGHEDRKHLRDASQLASEVMRDIDERIAGRAFYPYGISGLDFYEAGVKDNGGKDLSGMRRMVPGAAPGQITVVSGNSGVGKSTVTLNLVLGLIESGRKVLYGAWEMGPKISLELMACLSLGWSRTQLRAGEGPITTDEGKATFRAKLHSLEGRIRILENPFKRRGGEKPNNMRHLDVLQGYISDSGCDVFVGDLWKRSIVADDPSAEEEALIRQQAMAEEEQVHCILLQQQRLKDTENRQDTRPTREGIKGSAAWVEVADTILGVHRAGAMGGSIDDKLEIIVLKQRFGPWPMGVEFDWDAERGLISGGRTFAYTRGDASAVDQQVKTAWSSKRGKN